MVNQGRNGGGADGAVTRAEVAQRRPFVGCWVCLRRVFPGNAFHATWVEIHRPSHDALQCVHSLTSSTVNSPLTLLFQDNPFGHVRFERIECRHVAVEMEWMSRISLRIAVDEDLTLRWIRDVDSIPNLPTCQRRVG